MFVVGMLPAAHCVLLFTCDHSSVNWSIHQFTKESYLIPVGYSTFTFHPTIHSSFIHPSIHQSIHPSFIHPSIHTPDTKRPCQRYVPISRGIHSSTSAHHSANQRSPTEAGKGREGLLLITIQSQPPYNHEINPDVWRC